ncbi:hypothetical protein D8674_027793 [Pyrus ussuriensis x Pyrus communis]|uniref:Uncharacterized protein n=1 Tax=Pyrus ussuriensis x Pyrus communis TaxID=2448454 RepID=A0A5N5ICC7_9ROSA|nr:hypothetical protein D8674_027793 [Pyrus ussuriensis x Pyrus communis]
MDDSRVAESFDSLWFFGNVFSSKPMSPVAQNRRTESPPRAEISTPVCPKWDEPEIVEPDSMELVVEYYDSASQRSTEKAKRRRRRKRGLQRKRKILGELDTLGLDDRAEENANYGMPSISDNMAMKEHLKSWACAVASTVR